MVQSIGYYPPQKYKYIILLSDRRKVKKARQAISMFNIAEKLVRVTCNNLDVLKILC